MVFIRGNKIDLEIALVGVGLELIEIVGDGASGVKRRRDDCLGRPIEPPDWYLVVGEGCAGCGVGAGCRIVKLMRRIVAQASREPFGAKA